MLSQDPESPEGRTAVSKAGPFVIWNELWPPFSDLIAAHEAGVLKGQNMVRALGARNDLVAKVGYAANLRDLPCSSTRFP